MKKYAGYAGHIEYGSVLIFAEHASQAKALLAAADIFDVPYIHLRVSLIRDYDEYFVYPSEPEVIRNPEPKELWEEIIANL